MQVAMMPISESLFQDCAERAPIYDRENRFFAEDFEDLRVAGYLLMPVPSELGGWGMTLPEVCREQRRLAYHAPATALGLNMHLYWLGIAADLRRAGDSSLEWMLREAAAGEVFASGHAETGNDLPVLLSTTKAERVEGGYRFYGRKHFGSLSPVWTRLGVHGMDTSDPAAPKIVHAFLPRQTPGYRIEETWDVLGMRSTRSDDTILEGCFVPDRYVARVVPAAELMNEAMKTADTVAAMSLPSVMVAKEAVNRAFEVSLAEGVTFERRVFHALFATEDQKEGMAAFVEKRPAQFKNR